MKQVTSHKGVTSKKRKAKRKGAFISEATPPPCLKVEAKPSPRKHKKDFDHRWAEGDFKYKQKYRYKCKYSSGERKKDEDFEQRCAKGRPCECFEKKRALNSVFQLWSRGKSEGACVRQNTKCQTQRLCDIKEKRVGGYIKTIN